MYVQGMRSCHGDPASSFWKPLDGDSSQIQVVFPDSNDFANTYLQRGRSVRTYRKGAATDPSGVVRAR